MKISTRQNLLNHLYSNIAKKKYWRINRENDRMWYLRSKISFVLLSLTPLSTIFQLYRSGYFYWRGKLKYPTSRKSLTNFITYYIIEYTSPLRSRPRRPLFTFEKGRFKWIDVEFGILLTCGNTWMTASCY